MPGRKPNSDAHLIANRVKFVQEWMLQDHTTADIVAQGIKQWGVSDRQVRRYIEKAEEGFMQMNESVIELKRAYHLQRRKKLIRDLDAKHKKSPSGVFAALAVYQDMARLEGLYVEKHKHEIDFENDVTITIGSKKLNKE